MRRLLLAACLWWSLGAAAQTPAELNEALNNVIPSTPNSAAIDKFGTIPVDYSTGVPQISYPLWSWKRNKLSLALGLSYHAGGHKVEDMAPNTGLGWALTGIARISRTVRGLPDDLAVKGFLYTPVLPLLVTSNYMGGYVGMPGFISAIWALANPDDAITPLNSPYSSLVRDIAEGVVDGEMDIFSYSFPEGSGRFVINKNSEIVKLERNNHKISFLTGSFDRISLFSIQSDMGLIYTFGKVETQTAIRRTNSLAITPGEVTLPSSWLITSIKDPETNDEIKFEYAPTPLGIMYETGFTESQTFGITKEGDDIDVVLDFTVNDHTQSFSEIELLDEAFVKTIRFPDSSIVSFDYDLTREDLANSKALTGMTVRNMNNQVVSKHNLSYSYFSSTGSSIPGLYNSANNWNKRLRLDSIGKVSNDNAVSLKTKFEYNSIELNRRDSKCKDFWGYNVPPTRPNAWAVPRIEMETEEWSANPAYGKWLSGADRRPDSVYARAGVLEKIIYPTGGSNIFEYDCNRAFSSTDYFEDTSRSANIEWLQPAFGTNIILSMPGRTKTAVDIYFQTIELGPRTTPDPPTCFEDAQDNTTVRFEVTQVGGSFSEVIETNYALFLVGRKLTVDLPVSGTFQVKLVYDTGVPCTFMYPFKAIAYAVYRKDEADKLVGGLRIRRVIMDDGVGNVTAKEYDYNGTDGKSSAKINHVPDFGYYRTTYNVATIQSGDLYTKQIHRTSTPNYTLNYHNSAPLIYKRVREKLTNAGLTERVYEDIYSASLPGRFPYIPNYDFPQLSGLLLAEKVWSNTGVLKRETTNTYTKSYTQDTTGAARSMKVGAIASGKNFPGKYYAVDNYRMTIAHGELASSETKEYEGATVLTQVTDNTYDAVTTYLRTSKSTDSKAVPKTQKLTYAFETGTVGSAMSLRNIIRPVSITDMYENNLPANELQTKEINYGLWNSNTITAPVTIKHSENGDPLITDITFNKYDDKRNVLEYVARDGVVTAFIWGYRQQHLVAKITGKSYDDAVSLSSVNLAVLNNPSSNAAMLAELNKLRTLSNCLVTTYTYTPLVGVTTETDPNGITAYYEYDSYNRLTLVRDQDNNILKRICYNYYGQAQTCGTGTSPVWIVQSSTCQVSNGSFTGYSVATEQDMNPNSATYGQTRTVVSAQPDPSCVCSGNDKKVINGVCETGVKICEGVFFERGVGITHKYHYKWSDNSISPTYTAAGDGGCGGDLEP